MKMLVNKSLIKEAVVNYNLVLKEFNQLYKDSRAELEEGFKPSWLDKLLRNDPFSKKQRGWYKRHVHLQTVIHSGSKGILLKHLLLTNAPEKELLWEDQEDKLYILISIDSREDIELNDLSLQRFVVIFSRVFINYPELEIE